MQPPFGSLVCSHHLASGILCSVGLKSSMAAYLRLTAHNILWHYVAHACKHRYAAMLDFNPTLPTSPSKDPRSQMVAAHQAPLWYPWVPRDTPRHPGVPQGTLGFPTGRLLWARGPALAGWSRTGSRRRSRRRSRCRPRPTEASFRPCGRALAEGLADELSRTGSRGGARGRALADGLADGLAVGLADGHRHPLLVNCS